VKPEAPREWTAAVRSGDSAERQRFLESHLALVRYTALRIAARLPTCVEVDDLVHDGIVGLLDAAEKFDPAHGVRFRTYAESRVRGAILDGLRHKDWRPRSVRQKKRDLDAAVGRIAGSRQSPATEEEIAAALGLELAQYHAVLQETCAGPLLSLDDLPAGSEPPLSGDLDAPDGPIERHELIEALAHEIGELPERERQVLELYYHEELHMKEIGAVLGVTESRICQLHAQATSRLRAALTARLHAPVPVGCGSGFSRRRPSR
jgi:RNA polymerase sigma factor FliA